MKLANHSVIPIKKIRIGPLAIGSLPWCDDEPEGPERGCVNHNNNERPTQLSESEHSDLWVVL